MKKKKNRVHLASFFLALSVVIVFGIPAILIISRLKNASYSGDNVSQTSQSSDSTAESPVSSDPENDSEGENSVHGTPDSPENPSGTSADGSAGAPGETLPDGSTGASSKAIPGHTSEIPSEQSELRDRAAQIMENMTLEEKVAQMFFVRCPQTDAEGLIRKYQPAGFILFAENFENKTKKQVTDEIAGYQAAAKLSLLIGVDEEGGTVNRVSRFPEFRKSPFLSPRALFSEGGWELIESDTIEKCDLLKSLGINVNLAPVCDVSASKNDFIYKRAFSNDAGEVSEYVSKVVALMNGENIGCTLKHFPGYGNNVDTHTGIATDKRPLSQFWETDFLPFLAGIDAGAGSILVSHNIMTCVDPERPASLSPAVHELLREDLSYQGVIMTDDLIMDAIADYTDGKTAAVQAVIAGNDLLICSNCDEQLPAVIEAVQNGSITEERIEESVVRLLSWKLSLGIIE